MRIAWVNDQGNPHRLERPTRKVRPLSGCTRGKLITVHVGEIDAGTLQDLTVLQHSGQATATTGPVPLILTEDPAIGFLEGSAEPALKIQQVVSHVLGLSRRHQQGKLRWHFAAVKSAGLQLHSHARHPDALNRSDLWCLELPSPRC